MSSTDEPKNVICEPPGQTNDEAPTNGAQASDPPETPAEDLAPQPPGKPKPKAKPKGKTNICLADYLTSTKRILVRWDQILIDTSCTEGQVRGLTPDRVEALCEDLLCTPP